MERKTGIPLKQIFERLSFVDGQIREDDYFHNSGWVTRSGEQIGFGDLSKGDLLLMSSNATEPIILLNEHDLVEAAKSKGRFIEKHLMAVVFPAKEKEEAVLYREGDSQRPEEVLAGRLRCVYASREEIWRKLKSF